jgi:hypothetical protein
MTLHKANRSARNVVRRKPEKIPQSVRKQANSPLHKRTKCSKKKRYRNREEAQAHCERMLLRVPLQLTPMEPYYCYRHEAWHVGHDWLKYSTERSEQW